MTNKKLTTISIIVIFILLGILIYLQFQTTGIKAPFKETTPLIPATTQTTNNLKTIVDLGPQIPSNDISLTEKSKLKNLLPSRIDALKTSSNITTTINVYSFPYDPESVLRIEIYNVNYNYTNLDGPNAIAFKESFQQVTKWLKSNGINPHNLQIIYGNRQYIQDTATYWVTSQKLLD